MNWSIDFAPMLPAAVLLGRGSRSPSCSSALLLFRRTRGALLRAAATRRRCSLALANPTLREEERESLANIAIVVVDESTSQTLGRPARRRPPPSAPTSKPSSARSPICRSRWVPSSRPTARRLVRHAPVRRPQQGAGQHAARPPRRRHHDDRRPGARRAEVGRRARLRCAGARAADRRARRVRPPHRGPQGAALRHRRPVARHRDRRARDRPHAAAPASAVTLKVRREGRPDETRHGAEIGRTVTIQMPFPHAGQNILEVELETAPGELTPANNRVVVAAEGVRENLRVLLVSGEPHAGERTWRNLLKSDAAVDLVHFTILRPPEKQDGTPINQLSLIAFPTRELFSEKINDFDLIIFDRYQHRGILQLLYYDNIARYVKSTAARCWSPPATTTPAASSLFAHAAVAGAAGDRRPAACSSSRSRPSSPATAASIPSRAGLPGSDGRAARSRPGAAGSARSRCGPSAAARVMNGAEDQPLLVLDRKGKGRVALLTLRPRLAVGARLRRRRPAHRPAAPPVALADEGARPRGGAADRLRQGPASSPSSAARWRTACRPCRLSAPGGETSEVTLEKAGPGPVALHRRRQGARPLQAADHVADPARCTAVAHAGIEDAREMSEVTATDEKLKPLVESHRRRHRSGRAAAACCRSARPRASTCRASPCCPTPACWPAPAGWASRIARPS